MRYIPKAVPSEVKENHDYQKKRALFYKKKGLDFSKALKFILKKAGPLCGSILEIGTGPGHTALALAKAGYKFVSVDKDKESLRKASLNLAYSKLLKKVEFYAMDATHLEFKDRSFDNIIIVAVFHHIKRFDEIMKEVDRVLVPGGQIILADFNKKGMKIVGSLHKEEGRVHEASSITEEVVSRYLKKLGYKINFIEHECHWIIISRKPQRSNNAG